MEVYFKTLITWTVTHLSSVEAQHRKQKFDKEKEKESFPAGCLIPVFDEDTVSMLAY